MGRMDESEGEALSSEAEDDRGLDKDLDKDEDKNLDKDVDKNSDKDEDKKNSDKDIDKNPDENLDEAVDKDLDRDSDKDLDGELEKDLDKDPDTSEADEDQEEGNDDAEIEKEEKKKHKCTRPGCNAKFVRPSRLIWHMRKHNDERPYKCDREGCDRAYTNSSHLKRHLNTTHKTVFKTYECRECGVEVSSLFSLKRHQKKIHDPKRLTCAECGAKFRKKHCYNEHLSMHAGVAMYKCDVCDQDFRQLRLLKKHQIIHDPSKTYTCTANGCNKTFDKWSKLTKHLETDHQFAHRCDKCNKKFRSKKHLMDHRVVHETEGFLTPCPHENCPRLYYYERNLDVHVMTVHEGRRFYCDYCQKPFKYKKGLAKHIRTIHERIAAPKRKKPRIRRKRKDAGAYRRSMASQLSGIELPMELEKRVLRRSPRIRLERLVEITPAKNNETAIAYRKIESTVDTDCEADNEKIGKSPANGETRMDEKNFFALKKEIKEELPPVSRDRTAKILEEIFDINRQKNEEELLSSLLNNVKNEEPMEQETSTTKDEAMKNSLIADLEDDSSLTETIMSAEPIVSAQYDADLLITSDQNHEAISRLLTADVAEFTVPLTITERSNQQP